MQKIILHSKLSCNVTAIENAPADLVASWRTVGVGKVINGRFYIGQISHHATTEWLQMNGYAYEDRCRLVTKSQKTTLK